MLARGIGTAEGRLEEREWPKSPALSLKWGPGLFTFAVVIVLPIL